MSDIKIKVNKGTTTRLLTAGKYCADDIIIEASPVLNTKLTASKNNHTYTVPVGYDGYSEVTVKYDPVSDGWLKPTGTVLLTENYVTTDVSQYQSAKVQVTIPDAPSGTCIITAPGLQIPVASYAFVDVDIPTYEGENINVTLDVNFTIDGANYLAYTGITWLDWITEFPMDASTLGLSADEVQGGLVDQSGRRLYIVINEADEIVNNRDVIENGNVYILK